MAKMEFSLSESKCEEIIANKLIEIINCQENEIYLEDIIFDDAVIKELKSLKEKIQDIKFKVVM